ncbi:6,7-dimethyl-8-ribityllumazine synthase subunit [Segatella salivae]|nr:6,7-dimethyl-8-ribityllumazine synthase subunit [Segatella salivae]
MYESMPQLQINAVGVVLLIAQGWRQPTLGYACCVEVNAVGVVLFLRGMPQ